MAGLLIYEVLRARRMQLGISRSVLSRRTAREGDEGVAEKTIEALETIPGRMPDARVIQALARGLEVEPELFYEWPIALARLNAETGSHAAAPDLEIMSGNYDATDPSTHWIADVRVWQIHTSGEWKMGAGRPDVVARLRALLEREPDLSVDDFRRPEGGYLPEPPGQLGRELREPPPTAASPPRRTKKRARGSGAGSG